MVATLKYHGVGVSFVSRGIDTPDKSARQLVTINGMMDEQYLVGLGDKVRRGQEGRRGASYLPDVPRARGLARIAKA